MKLPWDELADAFERLRAAERGDDPDEKHRAFEWWQLCQQEVGCVGTMLVLAALDYGSLVVQHRLIRELDGIGREALQRVTRLEQLVRELEERVRELTPGAAEPRRRQTVNA